MKFRNLQRNIKIRLFTDFATDLTQMAIFPFMAIYFSIEVGQGLAGILLMINVLCSILAGLYSGYLSDRLGRKKVMLFALTIQVSALTVMAFANSPFYTSVWLTYVMFLISNVSSGVINPAASAMIIDSSSEKDRPFIYGLQYWSGNIAIAIGATLGGLFFESNRFPLFCFFAVVSLTTLLIILKFIHETLPVKSEELVTEVEKPERKKSFLSNYLNVLKDGRFMVFVLGTIFVMSLEFQLDKYIAVRLKQEFHAEFFGMDISGVRMFSIIILINTICVVVATIHLSKWLSRFNRQTVLTVGLIIYSIAFGTLGFSNNFTILILAAFMFTLGELIYSPTKQTILAGIVQDDSRASYMAINELSFNVAMLIGSLGLTIGAFVPSSVMAALYFIIGIAGLICFRSAVSYGKAKEVKISHEVTTR
ncbi:MDR family MFS transporter [Cytobacillus sp. FJAT-54145]|uniref:MDR family MFS transporter n=1 Tax=Cytobacillus spartinae TaxID=3299023 RepID=A0ABW6KA29_9BACI